MSKIHEGETVLYRGRTEERTDDKGKVLAKDGKYSHVIWRTGFHAGKTTFESDLDLISQRDIDADGSYASALPIRAVFDASGSAGLIDLLHNEGRLDGVSLDVRNEPSLQRVFAQLTKKQQDTFAEALVTALERQDEP